MYHISDIKKYLKCDRLYYFEKDSQSVYKPYMRMDENIIELLSKYFHFSDVYVGERNDRTERFLEAIDRYEYFIHARFEDHELRINIPFMHKVEGGFDLCYIYYGTQMRDLDLVTYRICLRMLKKFGLNVKQIYVIYLNENYVRYGDIDIDELFICTNRFHDKDIITYVREDTFRYEHYVDEINSYELKAPRKTRHCKMFGICDYYDECYPNEEELEADSILTLVSSQNKNRMFNEGIKLLKDAKPELLEGNQLQYAQIMASRNGGLYIEKYALALWLKNLKTKPISFIDFEWDRFLIPPYNGMKPMDVVCFEYALYYIDRYGRMRHTTFVGTGDCRRAFVESMIKELPKRGPILAYNADGAECLRLKELANIFPEYREELESIIKRFVDMAVPFIKGLIYDVRMEGNFTLKKLVDICSDYSYSDLDIYDGMEAVFNWREIGDGTSEKSKKIINNLKEYCSLDAYGLYLVYKWLLSKLES
ncbi:MAG: DUF2779 domain-containing protein [Erysipelotrichaceae bacterium]|nr:DUF2779 domain-containing protein [Erysipelotrichaceae bacterium]